MAGSEQDAVGTVQGGHVQDAVLVADGCRSIQGAVLLLRLWNLRTPPDLSHSPPTYRHSSTFQQTQPTYIIPGNESCILSDKAEE